MLPGVDGELLREMVGADWDVVAVADTTGSTNDDVAVTMPGTDLLGTVVVADHQSSGRGRLDRVWTAPPRASVAVSVLLRTEVVPARWGWVPLLAGQAAREAVAAVLGDVGQARLKWPNDVVIRGCPGGRGDGKVAGLLAEVRDGRLVVGAGINTNLAVEVLPVPTATSLRIATGALIDPTAVVASYLGRLASWWRAWTGAGGDAEACGLRQAHQQWSDTLGRTVRVEVPGGAPVIGEALRVDPDGRLVVDTGADGLEVLGSGDVVHVR